MRMEEVMKMTSTPMQYTHQQGSDQQGTVGRDWGLFFWGVLLLLCGIVVMLWPGLSLVSIAIVAGAMLLVSGIFDVVAYFRLRKTGLETGWALVNAICSIILGIMFLVHPIVTASVIPFMAGIFVLVYGIMAIAAGVGLRSYGTGAGWGWMIANGIISILCALMFMFMPAAFVIFLGIFLVMRGITMAVFGLTMPRASTLL